MEKCGWYRVYYLGNDIFVKTEGLVDSMQMKDLMWEMFRSTGHVCAYLLYKEYEKDDLIPEFELKKNDPYQQKIPMS